MRDFSQVIGKDYFETFSSTLKQNSLRIITALVTHLNIKIYQPDIKAAYLNTDLNKEIYMDIPKGCEEYKRGY